VQRDPVVCERVLGPGHRETLMSATTLPGPISQLGTLSKKHTIGQNLPINTMDPGC
jgi:hypothetical protein